MPIEEIKIGDKVYTTDIETGEIVLREVKQVFETVAEILVYIEVNGEQIKATEYHPLENHKGAHTKAYKKYVLERITDATDGLTEKEEIKDALINALRELRKELLENPRMPYRGGM